MAQQMDQHPIHTTSTAANDRQPDEMDREVLAGSSTNSHNYLEGLSSLAVRSFTTTDEAIHAILHVIADQLGMRSSFLSHITSQEQRSEVMAAYNAPGGCDVQTGAVLELPSTFCSIVTNKPQFEPVQIENTRTDLEHKGHLAVAAFPKIGSYLGVPIQLSNGSFYGTLCAVDPEPQRLTQAQTDMLVVLARVAATQIERDHELMQRQRAEAALRESEQRYRSLVQIAPVTIAVLRGGVILFANPASADLLGVNHSDELIGRPIVDFVHENYVPEIKDLIRRVGVEQQTVPLNEQTMCRRDGTAVHVEVAATPMMYEGAMAGLVIARDISRRKQAEANFHEALTAQQQLNEQLERLNTTKSHFVSIVSHEFRTALTGIQGFSELMRDEDFSLDEMKEYAADINEDAKRLNRMITEMLDLDRMESGRITLHKSPVDINALLRDVTGQFERTSNNYSIRLDLDPTVGKVEADRDKLVQVATNLLNNAIKYSPNGGEITVTSRCEDTYVHVSVADQGIGIPADALESVFERFGRVESGTSRYIQGTGLGLPIVRQIIDLHGGQVWVESVLGQGSRFHFNLPITMVHA